AGGTCRGTRGSPPFAGPRAANAPHITPLPSPVNDKTDHSVHHCRQMRRSERWRKVEGKSARDCCVRHAGAVGTRAVTFRAGTGQVGRGGGRRVGRGGGPGGGRRRQREGRRGGR